MRLSLRARIVLTLVPLLAILTVLGCAGAFLLYRLGGSIDLILRENYASVIAMERLNEALERIDSSFQFALSRSGEDVKEQYDHNWKLFREALQTEEKNITLPGEAELVQELEELTERYLHEGEEFYAHAPGSPERYQLYYGKPGHPRLLGTFNQIKQVAGQILHINQQNMEKASQESRTLATTSLIWFGVCLTVAVALAIILALHTVRFILRPIQAVTQAAQGIQRWKPGPNGPLPLSR